LQFEVVAHRLEHEYGVKARIMQSNFNLARWVTCDDANELKKFMDANAHRVALDAVDAVDAPTLLVDHSATLRAVESSGPRSSSMRCASTPDWFFRRKCSVLRPFAHSPYA
jgi:peptide chain release factor 3